MKTHARRIGVHTSIAGGMHRSIERAHELGCTTLQIFSHNPRQWSTGKVHEEQVLCFKQLRSSYEIYPIFIHCSYLINLAAMNPDILEKSVMLLIQELDLADMLGVEYVVLHTGSASQDTADNARRRAIGALRQVSRVKRWQTQLLLENTAGERGDISSQIEDLAEMIDAVGDMLIGGICLDSCHAYCAGYDLSLDIQRDRLAEDITRLLGREAVKLIHLNDSKKGLGSGVDRHEHLGEGQIGIEALSCLIHHPLFADVPIVLETPKKTEQDDQRNLTVLRKIIDNDAPCLQKDVKSAKEILKTVRE
jgi:deoxyribonuclease-4